MVAGHRASRPSWKNRFTVKLQSNHIFSWHRTETLDKSRC